MKKKAAVVAAPAPAAPATITAAPATITAARPKWHVGFDCATKTFAFSLSCVDIDGFSERAAHIRERARAARELTHRVEQLIAAQRDASRAAALIAEIQLVVAALERDMSGFLIIADGETVDLFPGRPDNEISTVERLRAVSRYVSRRVNPAVAAHVPRGEPYRVVVEFQMGQNAKARAVASALVALFAEEDVIIVGPSLKNKVYVCDEGRYGNFVSKYAATYSANKAHAKYNFAKLEAAFGSQIPPTVSKALRGHIADSFMQVLGYLICGPDEKTASSYF